MTAPEAGGKSGRHAHLVAGARGCLDVEGAIGPLGDGELGHGVTGVYLAVPHLTDSHIGEVELWYTGRIEHGVRVLMDFDGGAVSSRDVAVQDKRAFPLADRAALFDRSFPRTRLGAPTARRHPPPVGLA